MNRPQHACLLLFALGLCGSAAFAIEKLAPLEPEDGAVLSGQPVFRITYEGVDEPAQVRALRFRITLTRDGLDSPAFIFDQREQATGWAGSGEGVVLFRPRRPLPDGEYAWRAACWNGVEWETAERTYSLRVDSTDPAEVEGLRLEYDRQSGRTYLRWNPVTLDRNGDPEFVVRYHVYRFDHGPFAPIAPREIATTELPELATDDADASATRYYRVTAQDQAGNEPGKRR